MLRNTQRPAARGSAREVATVIAKTSAGKTALLQNILRHIARCLESTSLFCSLEQPAAQVFERFSQLATGGTGEAIEAGWEDPVEQDRIRTAVIQDLTNDRTLTCDMPGLRMGQLDQALDAAEEKTGKTVNVLAIDYLGLLDTSDLDKTLYGQVSRAARELKTLAKRRDLAVICLCQVARSSGDDASAPLNIHSARESGAIEESADFLLGLYRPKQDTIKIQILKNRKGHHGVEFSYNFNTTSLRIG